MKTLAAIGTFVAGASVGFITCGVIVANGVLKSEKHRKALAKLIAEKLDDGLYKTSSSRVSYKTYSNYRPRSRVSYRDRYDHNNNQANQVERIVLNSRDKAETILNNLKQIISDYGHVSVAYLYDLCDLPTSYKDSEKGWISTDGIIIVEVDEDYELRLPKPVVIK